MRDYMLHQAEMRDQTYVFPKLHRLLRAWRARRQLRALEQLDDHVLKDIGLTRSQVARSLRLPYDLDPVAELMRVRQPPRGRVPRRSK